MIRTRAAAFSFACFCLALLMPVLTGRGQTAALPAIPDEVKTATNVTAHQAAIQQFVTMAVGQLATDSADAQTKARAALTSAALVKGQPTASPAYLAAYAKLLNDAVVPLAGNPSVRVRLNAAIIVAQIARIANNAALAPAAIVFISDKSEAVVLWGLKAARWLVPAQLGAFGSDKKLLDAILPAVKAHPQGTVGGAIAMDAYDALALDVFDPARLKVLKPEMLKTVIPYVQDLMAFRLTLYQRGVPPEPRGEKTGATYLVHDKVWPLQTPAEQLKTAQLLSDLLSLASAQALKANTGDQGELISMIQILAKSISVLAERAGDKNLVAVVLPLTNPPRGTTAQQIAAMVKPVYPAVKASPNFVKVAPAPPVLGNEAAPPPASAPTTGPVVIPGALPPPAPGAAPATAPKPPAPGPTGANPPANPTNRQ